MGESQAVVFPVLLERGIVIVIITGASPMPLLGETLVVSGFYPLPLFHLNWVIPALYTNKMKSQISFFSVLIMSYWKYLFSPYVQKSKVLLFPNLRTNKLKSMLIPEVN